MQKIYLAGPIADISYSEATDWREDVSEALMSMGIEPLSPMRDHEHLTTSQRLSKTLDDDEHLPTRTRKGIMSRDFYDVRTCDAILVNFLGAQRVSMGTVMEVAWAFQSRTPIIAAIEEDKTNIHEHGMLNEAIDFRVSSLEAAVDVVASLFNTKRKRQTNDKIISGYCQRIRTRRD